MKVAFATTFNSQDVSNWSGTPLNMSTGFANAGDEIIPIGNLKRRLPKYFKIKQFWKQLACGQRESPRFNITTAKYYSEQTAKLLTACTADIVIAPQINPIAYLDTNKPIVLWTDALYASLIGFYPGFSNHSASSIAQGNIITRECLSRCSLAIFSSDWAARTAIEIYGVSHEKVKVVPFGANIDCTHSLSDITAMLKRRSKNAVKLLFLGKHWDRKGGDTVFEVAKKCHALGIPVELNFVGCYPPKGTEIPNYIHCHGFISKRTAEGREKINRLLSESHFLFVPSRAEAYGIVFCEANAFGLPCLSTHVGGISTIIKNNINGMTFALDAPSDLYCQYIANLMQNYAQYEALALSSFNEFQTRLNWPTATQSVKQIINERLF